MLATTNLIENLLKKAYELRASDLHLTVGLAPTFRINGKLTQQGGELLTAEAIESMILSVLPAGKRAEFEAKGEADFNYTLEGYCRFRMNVYRQQNAGALAARLIPSEIPTIDVLNMPQALYQLAEKPQGLILVTGPTGSGKSTTLAAMIN